jgi:hypothetical protein
MWKSGFFLRGESVSACAEKVEKRGAAGDDLWTKPSLYFCPLSFNTELSTYPHVCVDNSTYSQRQPFFNTGDIFD